MIKNETDPRNVFLPGYWQFGDFRRGAPTPLEHGTIGARRIKLTSRLLGSLVGDVIEGRRNGEIFRAGRYNPTDPDLSDLPYHQPLAVLISDIETLSFNNPRQKGKTPAVSDIHTAAPRTLLQRATARRSGYTIYQPAVFSYSSSNGELDYKRAVAVSMQFPTKTYPEAREVVHCQVPVSGDSLPVTTLTNNEQLKWDCEIGETYSHELQGRLGGYPQTKMLRRLVSLEVCIDAQTAEQLLPKIRATR